MYYNKEKANRNSVRYCGEEKRLTEEKARKIRLLYAIFLGVFTIVVGILFIIQAALIYDTGTSPDHTGDIYSPAIVAERFSPISVPVYLWIAAVIAGFILWAVLPAARTVYPRPSAKETLLRLSRRIPKSGKGETDCKVRKEELSRKIIWGVCAAVCLLAAVMSAVYLFQPAHFPSDDLNAEIIAMLRHILPWIGGAFVCCIAAAVYDGYSAKRELPFVKKLIAAGGMKTLGDEKSSALVFPKWSLTAVRLWVFAVGVTFIVLGVLNDGMHDVLIKAINICTECIGLG